MFRKLAWIVLLTAAAAGAGCLTGSGAVRGETAGQTHSLQAIAVDTATSAGPAAR